METWFPQQMRNQHAAQLERNAALSAAKSAAAAESALILQRSSPESAAGTAILPPQPPPPPPPLRKVDVLESGRRALVRGTLLDRTMIACMKHEGARQPPPIGLDN